MQYDISLLIRERVKRGWSQTVLARMIGKTSSLVSQIENGTLNGSPKTIKDWADVLGIPMEKVIKGDSAA